MSLSIWRFKLLNWKKKGLIFEPSKYKTPWMDEFAQAPATLIFDDFVRVFFSCRPCHDQHKQYVSYSSFVDLDRNDLTKVIKVHDKPILKLGDQGCFDQFGTYPISVIEYEDRYLAYYAGWTRCSSVPFNTAIGLAISEDGERFEKPFSGPILSYSPNEPFVISGPKIRKFNNKLYLFYIAGTSWVDDNGKPEPVYKIRLATSENGLDWKKVDLQLIQDKLGVNEAQASPDVIYRNGKYHMFFCYRHGTDYRNHERGYRIGYASSTNLLDWTRDDSFANLSVSKEDGWDSEMVSYPHVFELDGKVYVMYLGNQVGRQGFGLAELQGELK